MAPGGLAAVRVSFGVTWEPIPIDVAAIAVAFAASMAFTTPMGYLTSLMAYGPGGYRFVDYVRMGAPLQLLLAVVTVVGIWGIWGV